ncbi:dephospho-CoA kinase [Jeotgalibaca sp. A122]|uniref:dephospho-CoA kinase n=1 Tax=Jeotgalibaca sp. A122 TaxID=3457322 RepID=UPI003FD57EB4
MTFILGLTGGIATGKSTVSRYFAEKGIPVVDADLAARKVVEPGTEGLAGIVSHFGPAILNMVGTLNRKKLGSIIFADEAKRQVLNQTLQNHIQRQIHNETQELLEKKHPLIVLDIPLLFESGYDKNCDAVMVVYTTPEVQKKRLMARNNLTEQEAKDRMASQIAIDDKKNLADIVIDNNGSLEATYEQVDKWLKNQNK